MTHWYWIPVAGVVGFYAGVMLKGVMHKESGVNYDIGDDAIRNATSKTNTEAPK